MSDADRAAYAAGLAMLARRELSEAQVRERLHRREHSDSSIDQAVERLRACRALDDRRVALAIARTEAQVKSRGRSRVLRQIETKGIAAAVAQEAVDEVFGALDETALLQRALARRLRGPGATIRDSAHFRRLYQQLVRQGFRTSAVVAALKARSKQDAMPDEESGDL
jgi:regulatory protein